MSAAFAAEAAIRYRNPLVREAFVAGAEHAAQSAHFEAAALPVCTGPLQIDVSDMTVSKRGASVRLTNRERAVLMVLAQRVGRTVDAQTLTAWVWGPGQQYSGEHLLRAYISYLRRKLEDDPGQPQLIMNDWGIGYYLAQVAPDGELAASHEGKALRGRS